MQAARIIFAFAIAFIGLQSSSSLAEQQPVLMNPKIPEGPDSYYATELKCPRLNSGVLGFSMRTPGGDLSKIWVDYSDALPVKAKVLLYPSDGGPTETLVDVRLDADMDKPTREKIRKVRSRTDRLYDTVCSGDAAAKARYDAILTANRKFLSGSK